MGAENTAPGGLGMPGIQGAERAKTRAAGDTTAKHPAGNPCSSPGRAISAVERPGSTFHSGFAWKKGVPTMKNPAARVPYVERLRRAERVYFGALAEPNHVRQYMYTC